MLKGGQTAAQVGRTHQIASSVMANWLRCARRDAKQGQGITGMLTSEKERELTDLRKEVRDLRMANEFLKKTTLWFAKQNP